MIPARNEARNLEQVLPELPEVHEVILVDGHSVDGTVEAARATMPDIKVVTQSRTGKGNALACGFAAVTGDIIVMFDADGSADPAEIPAYVATLRAGADFAKGSRFCTGGGSADITRLRRAGNRGLNVLTNVLLRTRFTDLCYGYNAFWADVLDHLELPDHTIGSLSDAKMIWGDGFEIETVLNCRAVAAALEVHEVASVERLRIHGVSNLNAVSDGMRVLRTIMTEQSRHRRMRRTRAAIASVPTAEPVRPKVRGGV